jgi:hypothetical protein
MGVLAGVGGAGECVGWLMNFEKMAADEVDRAGSSFTADPKKKGEIYELSEPDGGR